MFQSFAYYHFQLYLVCYYYLCIVRSREGNGNPLQYSCLENPRDGGAWWAAAYGVAQSRTLLKGLSSNSSSSIIRSLCYCLIWTLLPGCTPPILCIWNVFFLLASWIDTIFFHDYFFFNCYVFKTFSLSLSLFLMCPTAWSKVLVCSPQPSSQSVLILSGLIRYLGCSSHYGEFKI